MARIILVVEDSPVNAKLAVSMLERQGYRVTAVSSGEEALDWVAGRHPDLILLDIDLPGIGGCEVAAALRADPATQHIPIIATTTSQSLLEEVETAYASGCDDVIAKPLDLRVLQEKIDELL
ncbi:MAG: response regulator [Anaerolineae bacterium]|nr:response regulator [Anaerolineae bacterium]